MYSTKGRVKLKITPIEYVGNIYVKRDDLYTVAGVNGVKARAVMRILNGKEKGVVTAGGRNTSQGIVVANIAKMFGYPCYVFTPTGKVTEEMQEIGKAGGNVVQVKYGYKTVVNARARELAQELGYAFIPHSLETTESIDAMATQLSNLPAGVKRIVVPCGSGMTMAGILHAVKNGGHNVHVLGIGVGGKVEPRLDKFGPADWREFASVEYSPLKYETEVNVLFGGIKLDPVYEAKAVDFLKADDLLWVTGIRKTAEVQVDETAN